MIATKSSTDQPSPDETAALNSLRAPIGRAIATDEAQAGTRRLRILFSIMAYPPVIGGTEYHAGELAAALVRQGHQVDVVTLRQPGLPRHEQRDGCSVFRVLPAVGRGAVFAGAYSLSLANFLLTHRRYDIVQIYFAYLEAATASVLRSLNGLGHAKVIVRLAGGDPVGDLSRLRRLKLSGLFLPLIKRLDRAIVVSRQMREELLGAGFDATRVTVISNGVDTQRFTPSNRQDEHHERPTVVSIARLSAEKGLEELLNAWRLVVTQRPDARLILVGDGPQRQELEAYSRQHGLRESIQWAGAVSDVQPFLQSSDLFVLPSRSEGMPNALLEAMASGLACVATRVGGVPELITDGLNGRLVEPRDPSQLAEALLELLQQPEQRRRFGNAARTTVEERYSQDRMVERYVACYHELLDE